ncbi:hypothetical protein MsAg5_12000 [Methanosarcinaceae archaeon Ag5]|uniref:Uncharacterized protein n=1 Tax=Methanolapillus africanus TaxID=3028297 RepID=A0AAE4MJX4_9EURY|nr:hypothetical protein [Methanosarcinaceae archaeon Ag5]
MSYMKKYEFYEKPSHSYVFVTACLFKTLKNQLSRLSEFKITTPKENKIHMFSIQSFPKKRNQSKLKAKIQNIEN